MNIAALIGCALLVASALGVVLLQKPMYAALALVGHFLVLAGVYFGLSAHFLGWIQIIVYAGAVMVLFIFVIMLLQVGQVGGEPDPLVRARPVAILGSLGVALALGLVLAGYVAPEGITPALALTTGGPEEIGRAVYGPWAYGLLLIGVLLLVATIAAVVVVHPQSTSGPDLEPVAVPEQQEALP